ncbi:MAG: glycogen/starch/alpha-glucan phosphorylase, partial [Finegoldia magna]|nr:glycogen/starch/alpha-glucan phosphorylase [Finegoldia magna]
MIDISKDRLRKLLQIKLSYNSLVDLQDADVYEIRIALNEVIKEIISEQCTNITNNKSSRTYIVSFELMVENLFEDYIEKLNLKTPLQKILQEKYEDIVNMDNDLHLGQSYIGRFSVDLFEKLSKQGKFCKVYSIFYKNSQFKQQIIDENQIETVYNNQKTSVVFKRSNEYDIELDNNKIKSQIYDIPYINWNTNFIRLFAPKANPNLNYENFIRGKIEEIYSEENKLASICQFVYTPQIDEFGKYIKFLQQKFLADSIVEDIFNDE